MNLLLVDDEPMLRKMLALTLTRRGFQVFDSGSAAAALALFDQHRIDALVTDVVMEGIDGYGLADTLLARCPDLPVVFMSGYPAEVEAGRRRRYRRCAFFTKPFEANDLVTALEELAGAGPE